MAKSIAWLRRPGEKIDSIRERERERAFNHQHYRYRAETYTPIFHLLKGEKQYTSRPKSENEDDHKNSHIYSQ
jgi:hypothetical protein